MSDKISPYDEACQLSSPPITMKEFREQCKSIIKEDLYENRRDITKGENGVQHDGEKEDEDDMLLKRIGVDAETMAELKEVCSIDNLKVRFHWWIYLGFYYWNFGFYRIWANPRISPYPIYAHSHPIYAHSYELIKLACGCSYRSRICIVLLIIFYFFLLLH